MERQGSDMSEWLFDSIIQFLRSPLWSHPVQTFIDENCLTFQGDDECTLEHTEIHKAFREVVDQVLGDHLSSMGIEPAQFVSACEEGKNKELHALVSEYILALDDFVVFKKMMDKRNVELELEALRSLKLGIPLQHEEAFVPQEDPAEALKREREEEERQMIEAAIAESIQQSDLYQKELEMEEKQLEHALAISLALEEERVRVQEEENRKLAEQDAKKAEEEKKRLEEEHKKNVEAIQASYSAEKAEMVHRKTACIAGTAEASVSAVHAAAKPAPAPVPAPVPTSDSDAPSESKPTATSAATPDQKHLQTPTLGNVRIGPLGHGAFGPQRAVLPDIKSSGAPKPAAAAAPTAPAAPAAPAAGPGQPNAEELAKRAEYLKQQRQRLLEAKKQERGKEMEEWEKAQGQKKQAEAPAKEELDEAQREMRLALSRRFKDDLIHEGKQAALRAGN